MEPGHDLFCFLFVGIDNSPACGMDEWRFYPGLGGMTEEGVFPFLFLLFVESIDG